MQLSLLQSWTKQLGQVASSRSYCQWTTHEAFRNFVKPHCERSSVRFSHWCGVCGQILDPPFFFRVQKGHPQAPWSSNMARRGKIATAMVPWWAMVSELLSPCQHRRSSSFAMAPWGYIYIYYIYYIYIIYIYIILYIIYYILYIIYYILYIIYMDIWIYQPEQLEVNTMEKFRGGIADIGPSLLFSFLVWLIMADPLLELAPQQRFIQPYPAVWPWNLQLKSMVFNILTCLWNYG